MSRPMHIADKPNVVDLQVVTNRESHKMEDIEHDKHVNVGFYDVNTREYISIAGEVQVKDDKQLIHKLYNDGLKVRVCV